MTLAEKDAARREQHNKQHEEVKKEREHRASGEFVQVRVLHKELASVGQV